MFTPGKDPGADWLSVGDRIRIFDTSTVEGRSAEIKQLNFNPLPLCLSVREVGDDQWPSLCRRPAGHRKNHAVHDFNGRVVETWLDDLPAFNVVAFVRAGFAQAFPWLRLPEELAS